MTTPELRKHIGKIIEWEEGHFDAHRGSTVVRRARLDDVQGRNVFVNGGDVKWKPNMRNLKVIE